MTATLLPSNRKTRHLTGLIAILLFGFSTIASALDADRDEPIHIQADSATMDDKTGTSVYQGNVVIDQGTLEITADEVEVFTSEREVTQIIATSFSDKLAHYEQLPEDNEFRVYADAKKITYLVQKEKLHLSGSATIKQNKDVLVGELVYYDITQGIMSLKSDSNNRVDITINPKAK